MAMAVVAVVGILDRDRTLLFLGADRARLFRIFFVVVAHGGAEPLHEKDQAGRRHSSCLFPSRPPAVGWRDVSVRFDYAPRRLVVRGRVVLVGWQIVAILVGI